AFDAVVDGGDEQRRRRWATALAAGSNLLGQIGVELRETFQIAFWVTGGDGAGVRGPRRSPGPRAAQHFRSFAELCEFQCIRLLLMPLKACFFSVDAQAQIVSVASGN